LLSVSDVPPSTTTPAFHVYQLLPAVDPSFRDRHLLPSGGLSLSQAKFFGRLVLVLFDVIDLEVTVTDSTLLSGALHYWYRLLERFMSSTLWDDSAKRWTYLWTSSLRQLLSIFREWCRACERHPTGGFSDTPDISLTASYVAVAPFLHRAVLLSSDTRPRALQQLQLWKTRLDSSFEQALTGNWVLGTPEAHFSPIGQPRKRDRPDISPQDGKEKKKAPPSSAPALTVSKPILGPLKTKSGKSVAALLNDCMKRRCETVQGVSFPVFSVADKQGHETSHYLCFNTLGPARTNTCCRTPESCRTPRGAPRLHIDLADPQWSSKPAKFWQPLVDLLRTPEFSEHFQPSAEFRALTKDTPW
jgi:hypothetical protein